MPADPFDPDDSARFRPADPRTQEELGGVLERAFQRERGRDPNAEEVRRFHALADEALRQAEIRLSLAREAEAAAERAGDLAESQRFTEAADRYRRQAREFRESAEDLRGRT